MTQITGKIRLVIVTALALVLITSCNPTKEFEKEEEEKIQTYLSSHPEIDFVRKASGLYYCDIVEGSGNQPAINDSVFFDYTMSLLDDFELQDTSYFAKIGEGFLIRGVEEGLTYMKEGGTAKLLIPSSLGYGNSGYYFPAWTPLLFDLKITRLVPAEKK
ncbi:MAG: hypothetical protein QG576_26 [Bacteroidota bacterium]|nr:hypothetical protein [Bacteroidota bacterium]